MRIWKLIAVAHIALTVADRLQSCIWEATYYLPEIPLMHKDLLLSKNDCVLRNDPEKDTTSTPDCDFSGKLLNQQL